MIAHYHKLALTASLVLAMSLTLSCSGDGGGGDNNPGGTSSAVISSSSGNGGSSSSGVSSSGGSSSGAGSSSSFSSPSSSSTGGAASETVVIGGKTWQAKNLSVNVSGSKCGGADGYLKDEDTENCAKYGRLYDWATAMALPPKCNSTLSTSDAECAITTPNHRGICPSGWHIPSNAEWDALYRSADGTSGTDSPYSSPTAGKHLKAKEGWTDCGPSGSGKANLCEDTHNFSALPGGSGYSNGSFYDAGNNGYWWSASEYGSYNAYGRGMYYDGELARYYDNNKGNLFSVRCLQDSP